jgi:hypothetical protein
MRASSQWDTATGHTTPARRDKPAYEIDFVCQGNQDG